jgi:hypothetical protein
MVSRSTPASRIVTRSATNAMSLHLRTFRPFEGFLLVCFEFRYRSIFYVALSCNDHSARVPRVFEADVRYNRYLSDICVNLPLTAWRDCEQCLVSWHSAQR